MKQKTPAMKWLVCFTLALGIAEFASADTAPQSEPKETRLCWSLFWGAYTRPGCPQPVKNDMKSSKSVAISNSEESKSILFGVVQWQRSKTSIAEQAN
jgi:hypothetical protein